MPSEVNELLSKIKDAIIIPIIELLFVLALIYFLWGVVQFILNLNSPAERQTGQRHMFWGIVGLAIMLSAFGIARFVFNTVTDDGRARGINNTPIPTPSIIQEGRF